MPKFQADFSAFGTIYVDAADKDAARAKMEKFINKHTSIDFPGDLLLDGEGSFISGAWTGIALENNMMEADDDDQVS